jgi:uncharacterized cupredoxin-like copper-binding protein
MILKSFPGCGFARLRAFIMLLIVLVIAGFLTGCGEPLPPERSLTVVATEMRFEPDELRARVGELVFIRMDNEGTEAHNLILELPHADRQISANPGTSSVLSFRATEPGEYRFYCSIPGHEAQTGILIVEP